MISFNCRRTVRVAFAFNTKRDSCIADLEVDCSILRRQRDVDQFAERNCQRQRLRGRLHLSCRQSLSKVCWRRRQCAEVGPDGQDCDGQVQIRVSVKGKTSYGIDCSRYRHRTTEQDCPAGKRQFWEANGKIRLRGQDFNGSDIVFQLERDGRQTAQQPIYQVDRNCQAHAVTGFQPTIFLQKSDRAQCKFSAPASRIDCPLAGTAKAMQPANTMLAAQRHIEQFRQLPPSPATYVFFELF